MQVYSENYPSSYRDFIIKGFREGMKVSVRIIEDVRDTRKLVTQFHESAEIDPVHDDHIDSDPVFRHMVEKAKQAIRNIDVPLSDTEADIFGSTELIHSEDKQGKDGNMYRLKLFKSGKEILAAINLLTSLHGKEDEINVHFNRYAISEDISVVLNKERLIIESLVFSIK